MFHHFYSQVHPKGQGAISAKELVSIINFIGRSNILAAVDFMQLALKNQLRPEQTCLTFDDNLRCQYDVAWPVLQKLKLSAFWFIYTSPFENVNEKLEIYRYYRTVRFKNVEAFYDRFFKICNAGQFNKLMAQGLAKYPADYLKNFSFYSDSDRRFRYLRDQVLKDKYFMVMDQIIDDDPDFNLKQVRKLLWMDETCIHNLVESGQIIGLHSHTHPTTMANLSQAQQQKEYLTNFKIVKRLTGQAPLTASYPCDAVNVDTLPILKKLGVKLAFRATMASTSSDPLLLPRIDHAVLYKEMSL